MVLQKQKATYLLFLQEVKALILQGHQKVVFAVNTALVQTYWMLGQRIALQQSLFTGRNNYVEQLAKDLQAEFPEIKEFSRSNKFFITKFYQFYSEDNSVLQAVRLEEDSPLPLSPQPTDKPAKKDSVQQAVGQKNILTSVPWGHHLGIRTKLKDTGAALLYLQQIIENNWNRSILSLQIEQDRYIRQGKSCTNFQITRPEKQTLLNSRLEEITKILSGLLKFVNRPL